MLIDKNFKVKCGKAETGHEKGIVIVNNARELRLKASDYFEWKAWVVALKTARKESPWGPMSTTPHGSFAPARPLNRVKFFIDGEGYFE